MEPHDKKNKVRKVAKVIAWTLGGVVAGVALLMVCAVWYLNSKNLAPMTENLASEHINGKLTLKDLRVSWRPGLFILGVELDDLSVVSHAFDSLSVSERGLMPVYADSLLTIDHLTGALDLKRLIFKNEISLHDVSLSGLSVNLVIAHNGKANYEIVKIKPDSSEKNKGKSPTFSINKFSLDHPREIRFYNAADSTSASVLLLTDAAVDGHDQPTYRLKINGNVASPKVTLLTNLEQVSFGINGKMYWDPANPGLVAMDEMELRGGFIKAVVSGEVDLTDNPIIKKATIDVKPVSITDLLTLVPDSVKRLNGLVPPNFFTDARIEGRIELTQPMNLATDTFPSSMIHVFMAPAILRHGPSELNNLSFDATAKTLANLPDSTVITLDKFTMDGPGTQFRASATVATPVSDPTFDARIDGKIDFRDLPPIALGLIPGYLSGKISSSLHAGGRISMLRPDKIENVVADGKLTAHDIYFISADTSKMVQIGKANLLLAGKKTAADASHLDVTVAVDTATVLVSGIDLTFGNVSLATSMPRQTGKLKIGRFDVTALKDSAGARIRDIAGVIRMNGKPAKGFIPPLSADLTTGAVSAGTRTDRIIINDASIHAWMQKLTTSKGKPMGAKGGSKAAGKNEMVHKSHDANKGKSATHGEFSYISPADVRKYVLKKRSRGKHVKRVYSDVDADNEEILIWNLNEHFRRFLNEWKIKGSVKSHKANLLTPLFPIRNRISTIDIRFNNDTVNLSDVTLLAGKSDITVSGLLTNVRRALTEKTDNNLKGNLSVTSDLIDVNELSSTVFTGASYESDKRHGKKRQIHARDDKALASSLDALSKEGAGKSAPVLVPVNVDAKLQLKAKNMLYSDMVMKNVGGEILVYDGGVNLHDLKATSDVGGLSLTALYSAPKAADMHFAFGLEAKDFNVGKLAKLIPALDSITPLLHDFSGLLGADIAATCCIDTGMNIVLPSLNAAVRITGDNLAFIDPEKYRTLGKWLGFKDKADNTIHHLNVEITVDDGILRVYPFAFNIDRYRLGVYGYNNMDMDFYYHLSVLKSPLPFKFGVTIKGNPKKYKVRFGGAKFNENTAIESVNMVNNARINLIDQMQDVFRRGVTNSRFAKLQVPSRSGSDDGFDTGLSPSDSLQLIRVGVIDAPPQKSAPEQPKEKKKKRKKFWIF